MSKLHNSKWYLLVMVALCNDVALVGI